MDEDAELEEVLLEDPPPPPPPLEAAGFRLALTPATHTAKAVEHQYWVRRKIGSDIMTRERVRERENERNWERYNDER